MKYLLLVYVFVALTVLLCWLIERYQFEEKVKVK
jgi:hypothetical protein